MPSRRLPLLLFCQLGLSLAAMSPAQTTQAHETQANEPLASKPLIGSGIRFSAQPPLQSTYTPYPRLQLGLPSSTSVPARAEELPLDEDSDEEQLSAAEYLTQHALGYLGIRYRFGGTSPQTGLDCSGLVLNVYNKALGLELPRTAAQMARLGEKIKRSELQPGDLVFFNTMQRAFSHVGIYLGAGEFVHAPSSGGKVRVEKLATGYWSKRFNGGRRLIKDDVDYPLLAGNPTQQP